MSGDGLDRSKIRPEHLERAVSVYVRQSSLKQVRANVEVRGGSTASPIRLVRWAAAKVRS